MFFVYLQIVLRVIKNNYINQNMSIKNSEQVSFRIKWKRLKILEKKLSALLIIPALQLHQLTQFE